jgi:hypothetical protein
MTFVFSPASAAKSSVASPGVSPAAGRAEPLKRAPDVRPVQDDGRSALGRSGQNRQHYRDGGTDPVSPWIMARSAEFHLDFLKWHSAEDFQQLGIAGFEVFNTNAAPAVGELAKLLDENDHSFTAMRCLSNIGKPAEPVFCRALTNQDVRVRQWSIDGLASVTDDVSVYIARIKDRLKDSSDAVRVSNVTGNEFSIKIGEDTIEDLFRMQ